MKCRLPLLNVFLVLAWLFPVAAISQASDLGDNDAALDRISEIAKEICISVPQSGSSVSFELEGDAKVKMRGLLKLLTDAGVEGAAKYALSEYEGVLQAELAGLVQNTNECRLAVFNKLSEILLTSAPTEQNEANRTNLVNNDNDELNNSEIISKLAGNWLGRVDCSGSYLPWFTFKAKYEPSNSVFFEGHLRVTGEATSRFASNVGIDLPSTLTLLSYSGESLKLGISGQVKGGARRLLNMVVEGTNPNGVFRGIVNSDDGCTVILSKS